MPSRVSSDLAPRPLVDVAVLADLVGDEPAVLERFLAEFLRSARAQADEIAAARAAGDIERIGSLAHRLKASSRSIGALALGQLCAELEVASERGHRDDVIETCGRLETALQDVEAFLARRNGAA